MSGRGGRDRRAFEALRNLSRNIRGDLELGELCSTIAPEAARIVGAESATVMLLDASGERLLCRAAFGMPADEPEGIAFRVGEGVAGWVVMEGRPALIGDVGK